MFLIFCHLEHCYLTWLVCFDRPLKVYSLSQSDDATTIRTFDQKLFDFYQQNISRDIDFILSEKPLFSREQKNVIGNAGNFDAYKKGSAFTASFTASQAGL